MGRGVGFRWEWVQDISYRFLMEWVWGVGYRFRWEWEEDFGIDLDGSGWGSWV